jgi:signal transduction histidine kinase
VDRRGAKPVETVSASSNGSRGGPAVSDAPATNGASGPSRGLGADTSMRFLARVSRSARRRLAGRLVAAADAERERIEHELHDGLQQHLTGLRIRLALAADRFRAQGDTEASAALEGFGDEVETAIDEVRDIANGVYPALLTSDGLSAALAAAGRHAAPGVTVHGRGLRRCRPEVESAVYFCCLAALDNAAKHAGDGPVLIDLTDLGDALRFVVRDAGVGFDPSRTRPGSGIAHMRDRLDAIGGTLTVEAAPAHGTRVSGYVPNPWLDPTPG